MLERLVFFMAFFSFAGYSICEAQPDVVAQRTGTLTTSRSSGGGEGGGTVLCSAYITQPTSTLLCAGSSITLSASTYDIDNTGDNVQWYLDSLTNPIGGATGNSLVVSRPGTYYVGVFNTDPNATFAGYFCYDGIVISSIVPFDNTPANAILCKKGSVLFTAPSTALSNYQWFRDSILLPNQISNTYTTENTGNYFVKFTANIAGNNNCTLSSELINASIVPVLPPSKISIKNTADNCVDTVTLNITSSDLYPANITWFDPGGNPIKSTDNNGIIVAGGNGAGNGLNQLNQPFGIFLDPLKNLYVADNLNSRIMEFFPGSTTGVDIEDIPPLPGPQGNTPAQVNDVLVDGSSIYISAPTVVIAYKTYSHGGIFQLDPPSNVISLNEEGNSWGIAIDNAKNIYASFDPELWNTSSFYSGKINLSGGYVGQIGGSNIGTGSPGPGLSNINYPNGVYVDASNNVYVADNLSDTLNNNYGRIVKWAPGATSGTLVAGGNGSGNAPNQIAFAAGITFDKHGNLYVTDPVNNRVQLWKQGSDRGITIASGFAPWGIKVDDSDNVYVADQTNNQVLRFPSMLTSTVRANAPGTYKAVVTYPGGCQDTEQVHIAFPNCTSPGSYLSLIGQLKNSDAQLTWQTISTENVSYYDIQRSPDSVHFYSIGKVDVSGTINSSNNYSFSDKSVTSLNLNKIYYRLNEIETDGTTVPSNIISFAIEKNNGSFIISPNPVRSLLKVQLNNLYGNTNVTLFDMAGRRINIQELNASGNDLLNVNAENLACGLYIIQVLNNGQTKYLRFVKE